MPDEEKSNGPLGPALTLKYLVYKNLATISREKKDYKSSVAYYLEVCVKIKFKTKNYLYYFYYTLLKKLVNEAEKVKKAIMRRPCMGKEWEVYILKHNTKHNTPKYHI